MKRESEGAVLSTVFVDYDNIYLSLKRKNEDAAKRFAKDSGVWLQGIASGELITPTSQFSLPTERRIAMNRCYGNPVPRRNAHDNSTDMNSFPFIRHHFLRAGFEVIDCPPLTAQLKNSADIRIVMDIRDILTHDTFFDEFIILSGDADFTPVLHRLRAHARRTVVFANDHTAQPYTALSDGEIRESSLIEMLLSSRSLSGSTTREITPQEQVPAIDVEVARKAILSEVAEFVRNAPQAVPLETLADRAVRIIGRDKTVGTNWGGYGSFRELLLADLPDDIHLSDTAPYTVFDGNRHITAAGLMAPQLAAPAAEQRREQNPPPSTATDMRSAPQQSLPQMQKPVPQRNAPEPTPESFRLSSRQVYPDAPTAPTIPAPPLGAARVGGNMPAAPRQTEPSMAANRTPSAPAMSGQRIDPGREAANAQDPRAPTALQPRNVDQATQIQQSIARIHEACQAPALAPAEYRVLFDVMAQEITSNGLHGGQTLANITQRAREFGLDIKRDDLRFIYDVISEPDPWFEQGTSAGLFASRFRNFVVARCRSQGLSLSVDELDLIEAWFSAPQPASRPAQGSRPVAPPAAQPGRMAPPAAGAPPPGERWWSLEESRQRIAEQRDAEQRATGTYGQSQPEEEFPRIVRSRLRG